VRAQLDRVTDVLGVREQLDSLDEGERAVLLAFALQARRNGGKRQRVREHPVRSSAP
jgi:hypothetical protein